MNPDITNVKSIIKGTVLQTQLEFGSVLYQNYFLPPSNQSLTVIKKAIDEKNFAVQPLGPLLKVKILEGILTLLFHQSFTKKWVVAGTFNDIQKILKDFPTDEFEYGVNYNGPTIMPVIINCWNRGYRISTRDLFPRGDNAKSMEPVRVMWTKGTDDQESKGDKWYHQYVDEKFAPICSNGKLNPTLYVKRY